jgi:hypothetical protein
MPARMSDIVGTEAILPPAPGDIGASIRSVTAGTILSRSFDVYKKAFGSIVLLTALMHLPGLVLQLANQGVAPRDATANLLAQTVVRMLLGSVATGAVTYSVFMRLRGQTASALTALGVAFKRLLPMIGVALLAFLLMGFATLLLVVPGIIVYCMLYVAVPAVVVERPGVMGALSRSAELTKGYKMSIFLAALVLVVMSAVLGGFIGGVGVATMILTNGSHAFIVAMWAVTVLTGGWMAVAAAVTYHDLRVDKDGVQVDDLAAIFG